MYYPPPKIKRPPLAGSGERTVTQALYGEIGVDATDIITTAAIGFAQRRDDVELSLIGAILSAPVPDMLIAQREGMTQWHLSRPDLYLIYLAAGVAGAHGIGTVLRIARAALGMEGYWADLQIAGNLGSMQWSDASLIRLARSLPFSPALIRRDARALMEMDWHHRLARCHYHACLSLLEGRAA